ncbi:hypothetical protein KJ762_03300 [bacterium]|nr:hypothetical protein [bacterium]MBU1633519.1 hypothetical protein [bacterium]MBU1874981.1 hypothetical protein [bacterium]
MKTGLHIIITLLVLSFLLGSTVYPEASRVENTHSSEAKKPQRCTNEASNEKTCSMPVTEGKQPCRSSCSETEKDCPGCIVNHIAPFTVPDSPELVRLEIFQDIPGELRQNPPNHTVQPPVPPPVTYCG